MKTRSILLALPFAAAAAFAQTAAAQLTSPDPRSPSPTTPATSTYDSTAPYGTQGTTYGGSKQAMLDEQARLRELARHGFDVYSPQ